MDTDNVCKRLWSVGCEAIAELGRPQPSLEDFKGFLTDAGFEEIEVYQFKQPFGSWPKDKMLKRVGAMTMLNAETA